MKRIILGVLLLLGACRMPPDSTASKIIRCGTQAVKDNFFQALPSVNGCLASPGYESCLFGLINPVAGITEDVVACVLRDQGQKFAAAAAANPTDTHSAQAATRARTFMNQNRYVYAD